MSMVEKSSPEAVESIRSILRDELAAASEEDSGDEEGESKSAGATPEQRAKNARAASIKALTRLAKDLKQPRYLRKAPRPVKGTEPPFRNGGGTALNLLDVVRRTVRDGDVIHLAMPAKVAEAARQFAATRREIADALQDYGLNSGPTNLVSALIAGWQQLGMAGWLARWSQRQA